ncbi:MAG: hypothetical protein GF409_01510 [Candidatus Omnitrophica bacterium]|nr:hypothetical protein [Candidatus Omnitrophota bacterium]
MGKRLEKYKERCRDFWGACLFAGRTKQEPEQAPESEDIPPKRSFKGVLAFILWSILIIGIFYFAFLFMRQLWTNVVQPIWIEDRAAGGASNPPGERVR